MGERGKVALRPVAVKGAPGVPSPLDASPGLLRLPWAPMSAQRPSTRRFAFLVPPLLFVLLLGLLPARGDGEATSLAWRRSYGEALTEARIRNLPVFLTRHKDE